MSLLDLPTGESSGVRAEQRDDVVGRTIRPHGDDACHRRVEGLEAEDRLGDVVVIEVDL
jgi:hypothetical protein